MSNSINPNAFGSERTRRWAERINNAQNEYANKGFKSAEKNYEGGGKANNAQHTKIIKTMAPPQSGRTEMNKKVGVLGSGRWEAVG